MRLRRGRLLKEIEEHIVVLRAIPQYNQDDSVTGDLTFCDCPYPRKAFEVVVSEATNQMACILRDRTSFDPQGIAEQDIEYRGNITPPIASLQVGDLVIRLDKGCQELYIEGITAVTAMQQLELANRSKTDNAEF